MRCFETVRRGLLRFEPDRGFSVRVIAERPSAGRYFVTTGSALGPEAYASLLDACQAIEASASDKLALAGSEPAALKKTAARRLGNYSH